MGGVRQSEGLLHDVVRSWQAGSVGWAALMVSCPLRCCCLLTSGVLEAPVCYLYAELAEPGAFAVQVREEAQRLRTASLQGSGEVGVQALETIKARGLGEALTH